jgi:hypothetical protein
MSQFVKDMVYHTKSGAVLGMGLDSRLFPLSKARTGSPLLSPDLLMIGFC